MADEKKIKAEVEVLVLMKDHERQVSEAIAVSDNMDTPIHEAQREKMSGDMEPLRTIGVKVRIYDGDELRIEVAPKI